MESRSKSALGGGRSSTARGGGQEGARRRRGTPAPGPDVAILGGAQLGALLKKRMVPKAENESAAAADGDVADCDGSGAEAETSFSTPLLSQEAGDDHRTLLPASGHRRTAEESPESSCSIAWQVFIPFLIAGFGTVGAGMVLDVVQHWNVFTKIPEIYILVPALLGLKGNLEMTLASRLSTQANLGNMDVRSEMVSMIAGNLMLTQGQALVVGFLASIAAMVMGWVPEGTFDIHHGLLLATGSMLTASAASFLLGSVMIGVVVLSRKWGLNPDNIATPIAASLGDLTTLTLLSVICSGLLMAIEAEAKALAPVLLAACLVLVPLWLYLSSKNKYVKEVVYTGWTPVICSMGISSVGGFILQRAMTQPQFLGMAVYQPVINGVGGNLVAVQASRLSTSLHKTGRPGDPLPPGMVPKNRCWCPSPWSAFCGTDTNSKTAMVLLIMVLPGQIIYLGAIALMKAGHTTSTAKFIFIYLAAAFLQVYVLLYVCKWMVHWMWRCGDDPDNFAIPYLTALGDLLGTSLLALAFQIMFVTGDKDADLGD